MNRAVPAIVAIAAILLMGAAYFVTEDQARTSGILQDLKLESIPNDSGLIGAPPKFRVTKATLDHWQKLQKEGKVIEVQNNGALKVLAAKK